MTEIEALGLMTAIAAFLLGAIVGGSVVGVLLG